MAFRSLTPSQIYSINRAAARLGTSPQNLATVIGFESGFDPGRWNSDGYLGLIQFSPDKPATNDKPAKIGNQTRYTVTEDQTFEDQMDDVVSYLEDVGFKPGMTLMQLCAAILAGNPYAKSSAKKSVKDKNATLEQHVAAMSSKSFQKSINQALHGQQFNLDLGGFLASMIGGQPNDDASYFADLSERRRDDASYFRDLGRLHPQHQGGTMAGAKTMLVSSLSISCISDKVT